MMRNKYLFLKLTHPIAMPSQIKRVAATLLYITLFILIATSSIAQKSTELIESPLEVLKLVGNKLVKETPFKYQLSVGTPNKVFNGVQSIDFGRTFGLGKSAVAYATTILTATEKMELNIEIEHNDGCKIWLNHNLVYEKYGDRKFNLQMEERSLKMSNSCKLSLHKGQNELLIKSETAGQEWKVFIQPPATNGAILSKGIVYPSIGLSTMKYVDKSVANISNWLVVGPFDNMDRKGILNAFEPERSVSFGSMYEGADELITWTIPKVEVLGGMINQKKWGTSYNWNYHNGGTAWAMEKLAQLTGDKRYSNYAFNYCNFHLDGIPFVNYQVKKLNADSSANKEILGVPLLDFTLAPSLPLVYRLESSDSFDKRAAYKEFVDKMIRYAEEGQLRMPGSNIFTRLSPEKYTTWVDDMFMGIPFLIQASLYTDNPILKKKLQDDAANQVLNFNKEVWDSAAHLYCHAKYSNKDVKLPHWSRANGWGIWATSEVLLHLPKSHPKYKAILQHYREHVEAIVKYQNENGFWYNVIDRKDSKEEVSGTAIFTMAIARGISNGWLDSGTYKSKVLKAWDAIKSRIDLDGTVHDICMGSMCSEDVNYYINRPYYDNDTHGLFAVLFAGMEVNNLVSKTDDYKAMSK